MGFAIGYALSRGTLLVSALLGVFVYREFNGADAKTWAVQIAALYLFFAAALLLPFSGQLALLRLSRRHPRLRFARWLLLAIPAVFVLLAAGAVGEGGLFSGLAALFYLADGVLALAGWGLGWLADLIWSRRE